MDNSQFTSSLALPAELEDAAGSVWVQQGVSRLHLPDELSKSHDLQEARRQELTAYLQQLKHKQSAEPSADLTFGKDFYSLVQRLSQQRKTEYESIRGWVPIPNKLPSSTPLTNASDDPRIQEGLRQILQLDERLMQKSVEAAMVARETFPDTWSAADKKQAEHDQKLLLASLERERARQARANRLAHAVQQLDCKGDKENSADLAQQQRPLYSLLEPAEAALVEKLLVQDDADAWGNNPFDYGAMPAETGSDSVQAADLALLDGRIQAYQSERMWSCDGTQHDQRSSQVTTEPAAGSVLASSTEGSRLTLADAPGPPSTASVFLMEVLMKDDVTDHLTARRQAKQLADTLQHIDAKLRALQTSELPAPPSKAELTQLLGAYQR
ncbi:hypothetical protein ABBQ32_000452 [Trebouxia sp. C0010 RCD-2024]